jgi:purine-binding chemotaxis protein CheW
MQEIAENKTPELRIDWEEVYRRLEKAEAALEECWEPDEERLERLLEERDLRLAKSKEAALSEQTEASFQTIEFQLDEERYAIEAAYVKEVIAPGHLTPVPCTPSFVAGIINVHGQIVSVIDLRKFFPLRIKGLTNLNQVVIVRGMGLELGILADEIIGERNLPVACVLTFQVSEPIFDAEWRGKYSKGVTSDGLTVLAIERILADPSIVVREEI